MNSKAFSMKTSFARNLGAVALGTAILATNASAAIDTSELTDAITAGVSTAEGLVAAGLAILVVFFTVKIIRKAFAKAA